MESLHVGTLLGVRGTESVMFWLERLLDGLVLKQRMWVSLNPFFLVQSDSDSALFCLSFLVWCGSLVSIIAEDHFCILRFDRDGKGAEITEVEEAFEVRREVNLKPFLSLNN